MSRHSVLKQLHSVCDIITFTLYHLIPEENENIYKIIPVQF